MKTFSRISIILILLFITGTTTVSAKHFATSPNPGPLSPLLLVRSFPSPLVLLKLSPASGCTEPILLTGTAEDQLQTDLNGTAADTDFDGRDDIGTLFTQLDIEGSCVIGSVQLSLRSVLKSPYLFSSGVMEETANNTPDILDLPPFTATGSAYSFFDVYLEIQLGGYTLHNQSPVHITGTFLRTPPNPGDHYDSSGTVSLYNEDNTPIGVNILNFTYYPVAIERVFPHALGLLTLTALSGPVEPILLHGIAIDRLGTDTNGLAEDMDLDGLDQIKTVFVSLDMSGTSSLGKIHLILRSAAKSPYLSSEGQMEDMINNTIGILDLPPFTPLGIVHSYYDMYLELRIGAEILHNEEAIHLIGTSFQTPPRPGEYYINSGPGQLFDEMNVESRTVLSEFIFYLAPYTVDFPMIIRGPSY